MFLQATTSLVALIAFSIHAVGGCCVHHGHASHDLSGHRPNHRHVSLPEGLDCSHTMAHNHAAPDHLHPSGDVPCENHEHPHPCCDEESCIFAVSSKVKLPAIAVTFGTVAAVDSSLLLGQAAVQAAIDAPAGAGATDLSRPRLQTWLL